MGTAPSTPAAWWEAPGIVNDDPTGTYARVHSRIRVAPSVGVDPSTSKPAGHVRIVCISDTHGYTPDVPAGDVLIHSGDWTDVGEPEQVDAFAEWFGSLPHAHKICIAGNHDLTMDAEAYETQWDRFHRVKFDPAVVRARMLNDPRFVYLEDRGVELLGLTFYGSPWQPEFGSWAFNLPRGEPCAAKWAAVPAGVDVLITHGPPFCHGDLCLPGKHRAGCIDLLAHIEGRIKPKLHVFGHIHEGYGVTTNGTTTFANASTCTLQYQPTNPALVFDMPSKAAP